ncbi:Aldehyde dehydrogenase family, putative [Angomonas deanei]|uniref:Aldehyde dehydrogenase family, putative n=1 Tax=Angomonas deanei TaxID=59799 RepID=A0A7G2CBS7_9TRYP|nr:Aldehyde dehydrogenase family, putative [Angomonas deanei]
MSIVKREPVGVCGQIVPWNFPLLMGAWKLGPALATGNTIVFKPAELTPLSALRVGELVTEAGFPDGVLNIVPGYGATAGAAIAKHMDIDKIAFTGSTLVGREIMRMAAESNIKKVSLELGGKGAFILCEDADLDAAVSATVMGIYFNAGQTCAACSRIYVHEDVYDSYVQKLKVAADGYRPGNKEGKLMELSPVISQKQYDRVLNYIEIGKKEGATLVTGGARMDEKGYYITPAIFADVKEDMQICKEEIFGPVVCIMKFKEMDEVVARANDSIYGLAAGIWTRDIDKAMRYTTFLEAGTVWVNTWLGLDIAMPFGGYKQSGIGRENGQEALDLYTESKTVYYALNGPFVKN